MYAQDLDPNFLLPLWQALVAWFGYHAPLTHGYGALTHPWSRDQSRHPCRAARRGAASP